MAKETKTKRPPQPERWTITSQQLDLLTQMRHRILSSMTNATAIKLGDELEDIVRTAAPATEAELAQSRPRTFKATYYRQSTQQAELTYECRSPREAKAYFERIRSHELAWRDIEATTSLEEWHETHNINDGDD